MICPFRQQEYREGYEKHNCVNTECSLWIELRGCAISSIAYDLMRIKQNQDNNKNVDE